MGACINTKGSIYFWEITEGNTIKKRYVKERGLYLKFYFPRQITTITYYVTLCVFCLPQITKLRNIKR